MLPEDELTCPYNNLLLMTSDPQTQMPGSNLDCGTYQPVTLELFPDLLVPQFPHL